MQGKTGIIAALLVAAIVATFVADGHAGGPLGPPQTINYQGTLATTGKTPVTGTVSMTFSIYNGNTGGTALWTETQSVSVSKGAYSVLLGSVTPISLPFNAPYYLGVTVGTDSEMTPRLALSSSPYAFNVVNGAITDSGISASAAIADSKLAQITTPGKVTGAALTGLSTLPSGAGAVPIANGGTGATTASAALGNLLPAQTGNSGKVLTTNGATASWGTASGGGGITSVANGGTGSTNGSITGTGALTFTAGGVNTNVNLAPNGTGTVDVASKRITNVAAPTANTDAATKAYADSVITAKFGTNTSLAAAGGSSAECTMGSVWLVAGSSGGKGTPCDGRTLSVAQNAALFALLGNTYGGDGMVTFKLPDLRGAAPNGLTYVICTVGVFPTRD